MNETRARAYLLHPIGGLMVPRGAEPTRIACLPSEEGDVRIIIRDDTCVIKVKRADGTTRAEEVVVREVAEALHKGMPERILQFHTLNVGEDWVVRIYQGALWGLVIGLFVGEGEVHAPKGWTLGDDVTDSPTFYMSALAAMSPGEQEVLATGVRLETA